MSLPFSSGIQKVWLWDREGLQLHGAGATGTIGTTTATTAITIGRTGITTTFPGDVAITGVLTVVGGETFEGLLTVMSTSGAGAAGVLGPQEILLQNTQAATVGAPIRNPGYLDWQGRFWETTGGTSTTQNFGRWGAVVDTITAATGVPATYRMVWANTAGTIQWSASEAGNTAQAGTGSFVAGAAIVSGTALTGTGAMGLVSAGAGSVSLASAAGTLFSGTGAGAVTLDPLTTLTLELTDDTATALLAAEGARNYLLINTANAGAFVDVGNVTTNPQFRVLGSGQITLTGNVDALAGVDTTSLTTSAQAALAVGPYGAAAGNTGEVRFLELAAGGTNYVGFKAADALAGDVIWTLPGADAAVAGAALTSNAAGVLSFTAAAAALANERYVIIGPASATLSDERVLTGTANQVVVTDGGAGGNVTLSAPQDLHTAATPTWAAGTYTPGAAHVAFTVSPTWTAEDFAHTALGITATQNGANSGTLTGLRLAMAKATAATTLAASVALEVPAPTVAGTLTSATGIHIANQGAAAGNAFALDIDSQTAFAGGQYRAIRINGTGVLNALQLDTSAAARRKYFYSSGVNTTNLTGDADTGGLQFTTGAAGGAMAIATVGANSSLAVDANGTGAASFGTAASAHTTTVGSTNTTANTTIQSGTGAMLFTAGGIWDVNATGAVTIDGTTFAFTGTNYTFNGTGGVGIGEAPTAHIALTANGGGALSANQSMRHLYASGNVTEANSGTHADIVGLYINNFTVTDGAGTEAVTNLAGIYVVGPPIAGTAPANGPYSIFVDSGTTRLDGTVECGGALTTGSLAAGAHSFTATTLDANATGAVTLDSSGSTITIGGDADAGAIGIGTGASARTITIGNAASTAVNLNALGIGITSVNALALSDGTATFQLGGTGAATLSGLTSYVATQGAIAAPAATVAYTVTAGAHTAIATAADFTGSLLTSAATWTLADAATVTDGQGIRFAAPTFAGLAGGGTETVTSPATVYIPAAPINGGNVTFTNLPAALRLGGRLWAEHTQAWKRTAQGAGNVTIAATDATMVLGKTAITGGGDTVTLPSAVVAGAGAVYIVKDEAGTAGANNITVNATAGNIDGAASVSIAVNYGSRSFYSDGANWFSF